MRVGLIGLLCTVSLIAIAAYTNDDVRSRLPEFEHLVSEQRLRQVEQAPVRMVVYDKDHTIFALSNSFEKVIYDETDKIDHDPDALKGFWPDPNSSTGVIDVGWGQKSVERISGHFYHVWISDP